MIGSGGLKSAQGVGRLLRTILKMETFGMPPMLHCLGKRVGIEGDHNGLGAVTLTYNFHTVGWVALGGQIDDKSSANPSPTGLFAAPLQTATWPRQLVAVK